MTEFTKGKLNDVPTIPRKHHGLTQAIREMEADDALFLPAKDGETPTLTQRRVGVIANHVARGKFRTRVDNERNGVWVFRRDSAA